MVIKLYDPLTYDNLMAGLAMYFEKQDVLPLGSANHIQGLGIYSLFYTGSFPL